MRSRLQAHTVVYLALVGTLPFGGQGIQAQLLINEVCSKNVSVISDAHGRYPDWIELYNAGSTPIQLDQYHLSDRMNFPGMWRLPEGELAPGGYAVFFSRHSESGDGHLNFGIAQAGEGVFLSNIDQEIVHSLIVPELHADHSYGLQGAEGTERYFATPTPGMPNTTQGYLGYTPMPMPSRAPGFQPANSVLLLYAGNTTVVRATVDGSDPGSDSPLYVGSIQLTNTMVIKSYAEKPGYLPSAVLTTTYFIGEQRGLPIVSISTEPDSLFHEDFGLYMYGPDADTAHPHHGANFWSNRQIPARFEFFDEQGYQGVAQQVDLRIHGGTQARTQPQRALRLTARSRYGSNIMEYPFFPEHGRLQRYKHLVLRNSGGDFCLAHFRDGLWHQLAMHAGLDIDALGFRPVRVFINGEYWGLMNMRERTTKHHVANHYGLDPDPVLMMENENIPREGDTIHFAQLRDHILGNDMNDPVQFQVVSDQLDIPSLKDYFALEIFAGNADWPANNVRYWKPSPQEGKWRYLLQDLDATMNVFGWIGMDIDMFHRILVQNEGRLHSEIFRSLLSNQEFRRTFINRLADLMNTSLSQPVFQSEVDAIVSTIQGEVQRHYSRWSRDPGAFQLHAREIIPEFGRVRAGHVRDHVASTFDLPQQVNITLEGFPPGAGSVTFNTIAPELPFHGVYFSGNEVEMWAQPAEGFELDHWAWSAEPDARWEHEYLRKDLQEHGTITVYFRKKEGSLFAFPVPCADQLYLSVEGEANELLNLTLHDAQGRTVRNWQSALHQGVNRITLDLTSLADGFYVMNARSPRRNESIRVIKER
jgi:hypothetical protein